ncbi:hypothetical protein SPAN111604_02225 [Sphingomonas antarctica]|uniref:hypothetical protein n=1 Tax=Sphingomonas antarctica TaxID=2040274 RepID=UPI0039E7F9E3
MIPLLIAAVAALPAPLAQTDRDDLRCVAVLAVVAHEQAGGLWSQVGALSDDGPRFAARIGDSLVERGVAREAVRDLLIGEAKGLQKGGPLKQPVVAHCVARMHVVVPPLSLARCAAVMIHAADLARAEEPDTENTRELAALAPVVAYRAQQGGVTAEQLASERDKVGREPAIDGAELDDCARLAVEPKK